MHVIPAAALAAMLVAVPSFAFAESQTLDAQPFHAVDVASGIKAVVGIGARQSVIAESSNPNELRDLRWEVRNGTLKFWYDWSLGDLLGSRDITITIAAPVIDALEASSGASVDAAAPAADEISLESSSGARLKVTDAAAKRYSIEASSGASLEVSGSCDSASLEASSGASIGAKDLACNDVDLEVSSGAHLDATATKTVSGEASSGGSATVYGKPSVDSLESDSGGSIDFPK